MKNFLITIILASIAVIAIISVINVTWPIAGLIGALVGGGSIKVMEKISKNKKAKEA